MQSTAAQHSKTSGWTGTVFALLLALLLAFAAKPNPAQAAGEVTVTYIHTDISGNPLAATDENGNLVWKESYQPFGARTQYNPASAAQTQWFHGKEQNASSGLQYFGARWYDPEIGRFLGMDPVGFQDGNLHSFNRYAYGNNNPLRYVDPDGNNAFTAFGGLLTEGYNFATGNGFDGGMVWGALLDGYNGEGAGFWRSLGEDFLSFGGGGAVGAAAIKSMRLIKASKEYITAYRAVSRVELDDIAKYGFRHHPKGGGMEVKWFTETRAGAEKFKGKYDELEEVIRAKIPRDVYNRSHKNSNIDNLGPGFCVQCEDIPLILKPR